MDLNPLAPSRFALLVIIVGRTPAWVWLLLAGLVLLGWLQSRDRSVTLAQVTAVPVAMTLFSLWGAVNAFLRSAMLPEVLVLWLLAATAVAATLAQRRPAAWYDHHTRSFDLAGSWTPMLLFVGVFMTRYVVSVQLALQPALAGETLFAAIVAALYGAFSGVFIGRAAQLWRLALQRRPQAMVA